MVALQSLLVSAAVLAPSVSAAVLEHWWNITYSHANPDGVSPPSPSLAHADVCSCTSAGLSGSTALGREYKSFTVRCHADELGHPPWKLPRGM